MIPIEQLWYTWSDVGLEGRARFQIRAASPGLSDPSSVLTTAALRLCYYDFPSTPRAGANHVAYGWVDFGQHRFVFRRCPAGVDDFGRAGRFFAHVIVGPSRDLPTAALASRFASPFWFEDDKGFGDSTSLPTIDFSDIPTGSMSPVPRADLSRFCEHLISARASGRPLAVCAPSDVIAALLAEAHAALPLRALDQLSVSTYEGASTSQHFDLVGVAARADAPPSAMVFEPSSSEPIGGAVTQVVAEALGSLVDHQPMFTAAAEAADTGERFSFTALVETFGALSEITGADRVTDESLLRAMRTPLARTLALGAPAALNRLAAMLADGQPDAWSVLGESWMPVVENEARTLGAALGDVLWASISAGVPTPLDRLLPTLSRFSRTAASTCVSRFLAGAEKNLGALGGLRAGDRVAVLTELDEELSSELRQALLTVDDVELDELVDCGELSTVYRAFAVVRAIERQGLTPSLTRLLVSGRPELLPDVIAHFDDLGTLNEVGPELMAEITPSSATLLARTLTLLSDHGAEAVFRAIEPQLDVRERLALCMTRAESDPTPEMFGHLADAVSASVLEVLSRTDVALQLPTDLSRLLRRARHPDALEWSVLWDAACGIAPPPRGHSWSDVLAPIDREMKDMSTRHHAAVVELVADSAFGVARSVGHLEAVCAWVGEAAAVDPRPEAHAARMLRSAVRRWNHGLGSATSLLAMCYIAQGVGQKTLPTSKDRLQSTALQKLVETLVLRLSSPQVRRLSETILHDHPRAKKWWRELEDLWSSTRQNAERSRQRAR